MSQASFAKRQREKERRERAAEKAERRAERRAEAAEAEENRQPVDEDKIMAEMARLQSRFDKGEIELEEFMDAKDDLAEQLMG